MVSNFSCVLFDLLVEPWSYCLDLFIYFFDCKKLDPSYYEMVETRALHES